MHIAPLVWRAAAPSLIGSGVLTYGGSDPEIHNVSPPNYPLDDLGELPTASALEEESEEAAIEQLKAIKPQFLQQYHPTFKALARPVRQAGRQWHRAWPGPGPWLEGEGGRRLMAWCCWWWGVVPGGGGQGAGGLPEAVLGPALRLRLDTGPVQGGRLGDRKQHHDPSKLQQDRDRPTCAPCPSLPPCLLAGWQVSFRVGEIEPLFCSLALYWIDYKMEKQHVITVNLGNSGRISETFSFEVGRRSSPPPTHHAAPPPGHSTQPACCCRCPQIASVAIQERFRDAFSNGEDPANYLDSKNGIFSISPDQRSPGLFLVLQARTEDRPRENPPSLVRQASPAASPVAASDGGACVAVWWCVVGVEGAAGRPGQGAGAVHQGQGRVGAAHRQGARVHREARPLPPASRLRVLPGREGAGAANTPLPPCPATTPQSVSEWRSAYFCVSVCAAPS